MALKIIAEVGLDGAGFKRGLDQIGHHIKGMVAGAFGIYALEEAIKKTVEYADQLVDSANRLGIGVERFQELTAAAELSGAKVEDLIGFIEKLNSNRLDPKLAGFFARFGISNPAGMSGPEMLGPIGDAIRGGNINALIGPLRKIGGRGAGAIVDTLRDFDELTDKAHRLGMVMSMETAVQLKGIADQFKILGRVIIVGLGPVIVWLGEQIVALQNKVKSAGDFWGEFTAKFAKAIDDNRNEGGTLSKRLKRLAQAFIESGGSSDLNLAEENANSAAIIKGMIAHQRLIEALNTGAGDSQMYSEDKHKKLPIYSDELTRVGNFLGSSTDSLPRIANQQVTLLKQIEYNTRARSTGGVVYPP